MIRRMGGNHSWVLAMMVGLTAGCSADKPPAPVPAQPPPTFTASVAVERWFPLVQGNLYQYVTQADDGSEGVMTVIAQRSGATTGALRLPNKTRTFQYTQDGVQVLSMRGATYVLKMPIALGNSWRGENGGQVSITAVNSHIQVPAGPYSGCVVTREIRGGDVPLTVTTTFCPDVGIVQLDAASGGRSERAALRSYGPPVNLGPDGIRRLP